MGRKKTLKADTPTLPVPQTRVQAAFEIAQLGELRNQIDRAKANADSRISTIEVELADTLAPLIAAQKERAKNLHAYCAAHRDELTDNGKTKTVEFETGEIKWRNTPSKVTLKGVKEIIPLLRQKRLSKFIRTKHEVDKEAILKDQASREKAATIEGITITSREEFVVKPNETAIEEVV
ncbi:MAG: host-nuclease inhibitor Gam family protein [Alphaproteobacteria bacterium]